ncbi:MAG TPA: energy-coupling factor transporter transmembrane component T [Gemmatimonadales bacterium]|nr:energy-coupling factor transporter transmembrane component T [Gemmatimonadales bacterium]
MIGYVEGTSPLHRAHPYTTLAAAAALLMGAFAMTRPLEVWLLVAAALGYAAVGGVLRASARTAVLLSLPIWVVLFVLHGLLGAEPRVLAGPVALSAPGLARALVLGGRVTAIVVGFLTALAATSPHRLVEAMTADGAPFGRAFLLASTLTVLPRMRERAAQILEAQQCRGLRLGGSPFARLRALAPLALPLVLGALAEVDEQVLALDARGAASGARRTALDPPDDSAAQRVLRWTLLALVLAAYGWKFWRMRG